MTDILADLFDLLAYDRASSIMGMTFVPMIGDGVDIDYLLLSEAQKTGKFAITELSEDGTVPWLLAKNALDKKVLLIEGEEVLGGKQNRTINVTILLAEQSATKIPVSCVEAHRWAKRTEEFEDSGRIVDFNVRSHKLKEYALKPQSRLEHRPNQNVVWEAVDETLEQYEVDSETLAAYDVYRVKMNKLEDFMAELKPLKNQTGMAVFLDGGLVGIEYLAPASKFKKYFKKFLSSYYFIPGWLKKEARKKTKKLKNIKEMLGEPEELSLVKSPGLGRNIYAKWGKYAAHGLEYEGKVIQFSLLLTP